MPHQIGRRPVRTWSATEVKASGDQGDPEAGAPLPVCSLISIPEGFEADARGREPWGPRQPERGPLGPGLLIPG